MPVDSIGNYNSILEELKKRQQAIQSQQPETASDLNDQMIENAKNELRMQQAIKTEAKAREIAKENHENPNADFAMSKSEVEKAKEIEDLTDKNKNGIPDELEVSPEAVKPSISVPNKQVVPAVAEAPQDEIKPVLDPLAEAKRQRTAQEAYADIVEGLTRAGAGLGGAGLTQIKPDLSMADRMRKEGERGYTETEAQLKLKQAQKLAEAKAIKQSRIEALDAKLKEAKILKLLKNDSKSSSTDPKSEASRIAQEQAMELMGTMGIKYDPEKIKNLSEETISGKNFTAGLRKSVNELSVERTKNTEKERARKWFNDNQEDMKKAIKDFESDKVVQSAHKMTADAISAREMAMSKNPLANGAIPTFLSRASGEVGALSEADKAPFGGSQALTAKLKQIMQTASTGTLTDENRKFVIDLSNTFDKISKQKLETRANEKASQLGGIDFNKNILVDRFLGRTSEFNTFDTSDANSTFKDENRNSQKKATETKAPYGDEVERNGKTYKWNPTVGKYQLKG